MQTFDLVIVGGGMVGTALACALADTQIRVALIEPHLPAAPINQFVEQVSDVDTRVSALSRASQSFLEQLGAWQSIPENRKSAYDKMRVWDGSGTGHIQFDALELGEQHLGHIIENRFTAFALMQRFQQSANLHLIASNKVTGIEFFEDQWCVTLESGETLYTNLVAGADGALSKVREWAQFETREWDYQHHGLVCTVKTEYAHQMAAWQRFTEDGVLAFLPLQNEQMCSIVWSCTPEKAQERLALNDDEFCQILTRQFENKLGSVLEVGPRIAIPLRQRHAKCYFNNGIVLLGDAAHTIHPLAGQGVNLGLMDAYVLADELKRAHAKNISLHSDFVLARYERRRMPENLAMMSLMESFKRLYGAKSPALRWIRNWGMSKVNGLAPVKQHLVQEAMGLGKTIRV